MSRRAGEPLLEKVRGSEYSARYMEELFKLHPDDELLAHMWEIDPTAMARLMPEIGNETQEAIEAESPKLISYARFALNSLRITFGRPIRLTPRQRMRDARFELEESES